MPTIQDVNFGCEFLGGNKEKSAQDLGIKKSARSFSARARLFAPLWGHGRPRVWVIDVRSQMLVFQDFDGLPEVLTGTSARTTPERPRDIWSENFLFVLLFRS